jgi:acetyltransferase-like isoleucine patch superfamily enzyme
VRYIAALLIAVAPRRLRRHLGRLLFGWDVHPSATIGRSVIQVKSLSMGPNSSIGSFNVIRGLEELRLEDSAIIDARNRIIGFPLGIEEFPQARERYPALILRANAAIMTANTIDCADRVELDQHAVLAGFGSTVLTHSYNLVTDKPVASPTVLGHHSMVMSGCMLLNGTTVPPRSIVSAGSVVTTKLATELTFYRGNPAEAVRPLPENLRFFRRGEDSSAVVDEAAP